MANAPIGAVFVWVNADFARPLALAKKLGRVDLDIISPTRAGNGYLRGRLIPAVVVDHAARLSPRQFREITAARVGIFEREARR